MQFMGLLMGGLLPGLLDNASLQDELSERSRLRAFFLGLALFGIVPLVVLLFASPAGAGSLD
jgi:hypothetical protein